MIYIVVNLKRGKTKINVTDYDNRSELRQKTKKKGLHPDICFASKQGWCLESKTFIKKEKPRDDMNGM